jgi:DNA modification methylase
MGKSDQISKYLVGKDTTPLFLVGDALGQLKKLPDNSVDCVVTSPGSEEKLTSPCARRGRVP